MNHGRHHRVQVLQRRSDAERDAHPLLPRQWCRPRLPLAGEPRVQRPSSAELQHQALARPIVRDGEQRADVLVAHAAAELVRLSWLVTEEGNNQPTNKPNLSSAVSDSYCFASHATALSFSRLTATATPHNIPLYTVQLAPPPISLKSLKPCVAPSRSASGNCTGAGQNSQYARVA